MEIRTIQTNSNVHNERYYQQGLIIQQTEHVHNERNSHHEDSHYGSSHCAKQFLKIFITRTTNHNNTFKDTRQSKNI